MRGLLPLLLFACDSGETPVVDAGLSSDAAALVEGPRLSHDYASAEFYAAPFPSEARRGPEGIDLAGFPNPNNVPFVRALLSIIQADARGFAATAGVFFRADVELDSGTLPGVAESVQAEASAYILDVERGTRTPLLARFDADGGPSGAANLLSLLPVQGFPLRPDALHAAVVTRRIQDLDGRGLVPDEGLAALLRGERPEGMSEAAFAAHLEALEGLEEVAGLAVFRTDDPTAELRERVAMAPAPRVTEAASPVETFPGFCVYEGRMSMPVYQEGEPPYGFHGGGWTARVQREASARLILTVPKSEMPAEGYPLVVFVRTGGGGDRPLVDRGLRAEAGGSTEPGSGPAREFAAVGFAGLSVDGPHGGLRNATGGDEQFLMFNLANPVAMRDNFRQSALELALLAEVLDEITFEGECAGRFDPSRVVLMGHSMGATIAPLVLAVAPRYRAAILSGAGGSWIANIVHKQKPLETRPFAEALLRYGAHRLHEHDPVMSLLQWAGESADPPVYGPAIIDAPWAGEPRHVLMLQGIADTYILPPMANALSLAMGLDLAGPALDAEHPVAGAFTPLAELLGLRGRAAVELPVRGNRDGVTAVVVQHLEGPIEDGHEVVFQTEPPKVQYRHFLRTFAAGVPEVPTAQ